MSNSWLPISVSRAIRTGEYHLVTVWVAQPNLPMIWAPIPIRGIAMARQDDLGFHFLGACYRRIHVVNLEPQQHAIAGRFVVWIADAAVVVLDFPTVQLQHQPARVNKALVIRTAMRALAMEQSLIPPTTSFDIAHANQWLWNHGWLCRRLELRHSRRR